VALTPDEDEIYARQIVLKDIGYEGQARIKAGKVLLLGVGGLGSPTAILLAAMGLGFLRIVDRDLVSRGKAVVFVQEPALLSVDVDPDRRLVS